MPFRSCARTRACAPSISTSAGRFKHVRSAIQAMKHREPSFGVLLCRALVVTATLAAGAAFAQELNPARRHPDAAADIGDSQQIIVRFKSGSADNGRAQALSAKDA